MAVSSAAEAAQTAVSSTGNLANNPTPIPLGIAKDLPNAGIYMQRQNEAELAYQQAQAQLLAKRNTSYHEYGLNENAAVDPMSQFGRYQSMLSGQEQQLAASDEAAQQRGLGGGPGLGMQGERALRYTQGQEALQLQQDVGTLGENYATGIQQALAQRNQAVLDAQLQAAAGAQGYGGVGGGAGGPGEASSYMGIEGGRPAGNGEVKNVSSASQLDVSGGWGVHWSGPGKYTAVKGPPNASGHSDTFWIKVPEEATATAPAPQNSTPRPTTTSTAVSTLARTLAKPGSKLIRQ